jgi:hypothetical protein
MITHDTQKVLYMFRDLLEYNKPISYVLVSLMSIDVVAVFEFGGYLIHPFISNRQRL